MKNPFLSFKLRVFILSISLSLISITNMHGQCTIQNTTGPTVDVGTYALIGQSFTACGNGLLSSITLLNELYVNNRTLTIYEGDGVSGTVLGTVSNIEMLASQVNVIDVSGAGVNVISGNAYTFYFATDVSNGANLHLFDPPNYAGGSLYFAGTSQPADLYFEVSITNTATVPSVTTTVASSITSNSATLGGNVTNDGGASVTVRGVVYSSTDATPTIGEGGVTNDTNGSGTGIFSESIGSLSPGTTYYFQAYATNSEGTAYGGVESFITLAAPSVTTQAVTSITQTTATGNGNITSLGAPNPTAHGVCWNTGGTPTTADNSTDEGAVGATGAFTSNMTSLSPNTTYYVRAYATNTVGTSYGNEVSFTTLPQAATVTTQAVTSILATTATGNGNITSLGAPNPTAHGVCWNTGGTPTTADNSTDEGAAGATGAFTSNMTSLSPNTTYYVRAYATNTAGTSYGNEVSFTTLAPEIRIEGNSLEIVDGDVTPSSADHTDFGLQNVASGTTQRTFTVLNTGNAVLNLTGVPVVTLTGSSDFTVETQATTPVNVSGQTTFTITYDPSAIEVDDATVSIANNDTDENPYTFDIRGTGGIYQP